jgi:polygalacturonase
MHAEVGGLTFEEYIEWKTAEEGDDYLEKYERNQTSCMMNFMKCANSTLNNLRISRSPSAKYTLTVKMLYVDTPGRDNVCNYIFTNTQSGDSIAVVQMKGKGGTWGSFIVLPKIRQGLIFKI